MNQDYEGGQGYTEFVASCKETLERSGFNSGRLETYPSPAKLFDADWADTYPRHRRLPKLKANLEPLSADLKKVTIHQTIHHGFLTCVAAGRYRNTAVAIKFAPFAEVSNTLAHEICILANIQKLYPESTKYCTQLIGILPEAALFTFCEKGTLKNHLERNSGIISIPLRISYLKQIVDGVNFLHSLGVFHRDLKADNILIDSDWQLKIADFECATFTDDSSNFFFHGAFRFQSPQVLAVEAASLKEIPDCIKGVDFTDPKFTTADEMYTFTLLACHILTSTQAFTDIGDLRQHQNFLEFFLKVFLNAFRPEAPKNIPEKLAHLITLGWDHNPEKRPSFQEAKNIIYLSMGHRR